MPRPNSGVSSPGLPGKLPSTGRASRRRRRRPRLEGTQACRPRLPLHRGRLCGFCRLRRCLSGGSASKIAPSKTAARHPFLRRCSLAPPHSACRRCSARGWSRSRGCCSSRGCSSNRRCSSSRSRSCSSSGSTRRSSRCSSRRSSGRSSKACSPPRSTIGRSCSSSRRRSGRRRRCRRVRSWPRRGSSRSRRWGLHSPWGRACSQRLLRSLPCDLGCWRRPRSTPAAAPPPAASSALPGGRARRSPAWWPQHWAAAGLASIRREAWAR
mmetsp:Transcript_28786/g.89840  ORF Transcript_28786/g.89840 Transcript_28786/m.89840 type:complete len:268 (-) Transcript_28786:531-1334(-)